MRKLDQRAKEIFEAALKLPPKDRAVYLDQACGGDAQLRQRIVEALFQAQEDAAATIQAPPSPSPERTKVVPFVVPFPTEAPGEKPGDQIGRYKLLEQRGEGGMGTVWVAEQSEPVRRKVALKIIKLGMDTKQVIARFEAERQALALMDHPNIAKVLDAGATDKGRPYFVMEFVSGEPVTNYCDRQNLTTRERLDLFVQVCRAIQHAHQKGIIHRDIKPSNILVALQDGVPVPKVIDFGIAKATAGQQLTDKTLYTAMEQFVGTPAYMSPEQAEMAGVDIDTRSDIYSLGVMLYELLTSKMPFDPKRLVQAGLDEIRRIIREEEPARPSTRIGTLDAAEQTTVAKRRQSEPPKLIHQVRGDLDWIVMKCLEKDRTRRYETANGLAVDIQRHLNDELVVARPPSHLYRFQKMVRRNKLAFAAIAAVAGSLVIGLGLFAWEFAAKSKALDRTLAAERAATAHAAQEAIQTRKAKAAALELRRSLAASDFLQATRLVDEDKSADSLPYLQRCLSLDSSNVAASTLLASLLIQLDWALPVLSLEHGGDVFSGRFSPDGKRIVTASRDGTARVWDAQSGQPLTEPMKHGGQVNSAQFSPDGTRVVTASDDGTARVWDAQGGQPLTGPVMHAGAVNSAQFSPDGNQIVTASDDNTARVWDARSGLPLSKPMKHGWDLNSARFSPDGTRIVTASRDGSARVWDAQSGQPLTEPMRHGGSVLSAQFSPEGMRIVTASFDSTARVWDAQSGRPLTEPMKHGSYLLSAQFSPDGKRIVTGSLDRTARVWDAESGQPLTEPMRHGGDVNFAQFSPDGKRIVTASEDGTARVWDAQSGQPLTEPMRHGNWVHYAEFSPDGKQIVTAAYDHTARVWNLQSGHSLTEPMRHGRGVHSAGFSPDGMRIVTASFDGTARVWDAQSGQPLTAPMKHEGQVNSAEFSPDGKRIVAASDDNTARVWDARSGLPLSKPMKHGADVNYAQFSPDGTRIVTASGDRTARVWDALSGQPLTEPMEHADSVRRAQFSPDGKRVVTASYDRTARVWDAQSGQPLTEPMKHGGGPALSAQFSPDGKRIVTAAGNNTARVWDAQSGQPLTEPMRHGGVVLSAQFSPDGNRIVTASWDHTARVWDAQSGQPLTEPMKHGGQVNSAQFSPDGTRIVTASYDGTARLWDAQSGQPLSEPLRHGRLVYSARFSPDGKRIVTASDDGTARVWEARTPGVPTPDWLPQMIEALSGQVLSKKGVVEPSGTPRAGLLGQVRQRLAQGLSGDDWEIIGRWVLADRSTRTISPFSKITLREYIENRIKEKTPASLAEAEQLAYGNTDLLERISKARKKFGEAGERSATAEKKE
jgi:WD40 repeat protein/serine/threonine protein kinase